MIDSNLIRQGVVTSINSKNYTCTVYFEDQELTVNDLIIAVSGGTRNKSRNLPNIGDLALCIFVPPSLTDGWVIAFGYNDQDAPPAGDENVQSTTYPDGSGVSYDSKSHEMILDCKGAATIKATDINLNGNVIINGKSWLEHQHSAGEYKDGDSRPVNGDSGDASLRSLPSIKNKHSAVNQ